MAELTNAQIIEHIKHMSVLDLNNLVKTIEQEFGVSAAAATVAVGSPAAGGAAPAEAAEEKTEFTVVLTAYGDKKVQVIKAVRELTSLGLKEAKDLVDGVPGVVKEGLNKEEAAAAKAKLEEAGAQVEIK